MTSSVWQGRKEEREKRPLKTDMVPKIMLYITTKSLAGIHKSCHSFQPSFCMQGHPPGATLETGLILQRTLNDNTASQLTAVSQSCCFLHYRNCQSSYCCSFLVAVRQSRRIEPGTKQHRFFLFLSFSYEGNIPGVSVGTDTAWMCWLPPGSIFS